MNGTQFFVSLNTHKSEQRICFSFFRSHELWLEPKEDVCEREEERFADFHFIHVKVVIALFRLPTDLIDTHVLCNMIIMIVIQRISNVNEFIFFFSFGNTNEKKLLNQQMFGLMTENKYIRINSLHFFSANLSSQFANTINYSIVIYTYPTLICSIDHLCVFVSTSKLIKEMKRFEMNHLRVLMLECGHWTLDTVFSHQK